MPVMLFRLLVHQMGRTAAIHSRVSFCHDIDLQSAVRTLEVVCSSPGTTKLCMSGRGAARGRVRASSITREVIGSVFVRGDGRTCRVVPASNRSGTDADASCLLPWESAIDTQAYINGSQIEILETKSCGRCLVGNRIDEELKIHWLLRGKKDGGKRSMPPSVRHCDTTTTTGQMMTIPTSEDSMLTAAGICQPGSWSLR